MNEKNNPIEKQSISGLSRYLERLSRLGTMAVMFLALMVSIWVVTPTDAHAFVPSPPPKCADDSLFCIEPNDYSLAWLRTAFPELVSAATGSNSGGTGAGSTTSGGAGETNLMFTNLMRVMNSVALAVASLMLAYKLLAGVVQTANDGEVLGKRWSTLWGPLRVVSAAGLLVPTASGYSLVQAVIIGIALTGVGFANAAWRTVVDSMVNGGALTVPGLNDTTKEFARNVLANNICLHAINLMYAEALQGGTGLVNPYKQPKGSADDVQGGYPWAWAGSSVNAASYKPNSKATIEMTNPIMYRKTLPSNMELGFPLKYVFRMSWTPVSTANSPETGLQEGTCGTIKFERDASAIVDKPKSALEVPGSNLKSAANMVGFALNPNRMKDEANYKAYQEALITAIGTAAKVLAQELDEPALKIVKSWYGYGDIGSGVALPDFKNMESPDPSVYQDLGTAFLNAAAKYELAMTKGLGALSDTNSDSVAMKSEFKNYALDRGWASAGEWYLTMAKLNQMAQNALRVNPEVENKMNLMEAVEKLTGGKNEEYERLSRLANNINNTIDVAIKNTKTAAELNGTGGGPDDVGTRAQSIKRYIVKAHGTPTQDATAVAWAQISDSFQDVTGGLGKTLASFGGAAFGLPLKTDTPNPLLAVVDGGRRLLYTGLTLYAIDFAAKQVADKVKNPKVQAAATVVKVITGFLKPFIIAGMLLPGLLMGFILPMLPWVLWVSALLGWFILVVEAVIAGPIWALAHMRMDGEGISGPMGEHGYRLALSILMRPVLMVIGLIAGLVILTIFIPFIGASIWVAEAMNDGAGAGDGVIGRAVLMILQSFLMVYVCYRCFQLITHVPDRILRWIGSGGEGLSEDQPVEQTKAMFIGAMGPGGAFSGIGRSGGGSVPGAAGSGASGSGALKPGSNSQNQNQTKVISPPIPGAGA